MTDASSGKLMEVEASLIWDQLSERIDALITAWEAASEPPLADGLPAGGPAGPAPVDARRGSESRPGIPLEGPPLAQTDRGLPGRLPRAGRRGGLPCDVIYEEYHIRKQQGDAVSIGEYCSRFPQRVEELRRLFELESPEQTTALVPSRTRPHFQAGQRVDDFDLLVVAGQGGLCHGVSGAADARCSGSWRLKISRDRGFEPQTLAQLDHPHIVRRLRSAADGRPTSCGCCTCSTSPAARCRAWSNTCAQMPPAMRSGAALLDAIDQALVNAASSRRPIR